MAFIPEVSEEQADPGLRAVYDSIRKDFGFLPRLVQAQGSRPDVVRAFDETYQAIFRRGTLPPELKEKIGIVVSAVNSNSYCIVAHLEILGRLGVEKRLGRQLVNNFEQAEVPEPEKAVYRFAAKLTREPFTIKEPDVAELRRHGWDDAAILEISLAASYFNALNRLAAALGVIPEHAF
jgi:uncharacterized peroxidase-related enzyme